MQFVFIVCQVKDYRNVLTLNCRSIAFISRNLFKKTKRGRKLVSLPHFLHDLWRKILPLLYSIIYILTKFHWLVAFTSWDIGQYVYCNCLWNSLWRHEFWNCSCLSNQTVWAVKTNILRTKRAYKMKQKAFFIIFKGLPLKQINFFWKVRVRF